MLLEENCRSAAETDSANVGKHIAAISGNSSSSSSDTVRRFISAVSNTKLLAKPSYIMMSDVVKKDASSCKD